MLKKLLTILMVALMLSLFMGASAQRVRVEFWHGLGGPLGQLLEAITDDFNRSQDRFHVNATFRGSYPETMVAAIAAFRAGNAPHIVQMFEVGTATMMHAGGAIVPVHELFTRTGIPFDANVFLPAVRSYYSTPDGRLMSLPFNSSTAIMWYNRDVFRAAGLNPDQPPRTWAELRAAARQIVARGAARCGFSTAWPTWTQFEQFSAIHNVPLATRANGMEGLDARLQINSPLHVRHLQMLMDMQREGSFTYGGRDGAADALFANGTCAMLHGSSALLGRVRTEATFAWGVANLPHHDDVRGAPINSIIGGASFWVMTAPGRTEQEYRAVAEFFRFVSRPEIARRWHTETGFMPIRQDVFNELNAAGFYRANPGRDLPLLQLTRTQPTVNSRGLRLGNMPEIRNIIQEEVENALQGRQTAQQALDNAVRRGDAVLAAFERAHR